MKTVLKEANEMYKMYLYTTGERAYKLEMAKLIDRGKSTLGIENWRAVMKEVIKKLKAEVLKGQTRIVFKHFFASDVYHAWKLTENLGLCYAVWEE
ncbi:hypothetical protein TB2_007977 [Malus domestica]